MSNVVPFRRHSLAHIIEDIEKLGSSAKGVCLVVLEGEGGGHFRISGFMNRGDTFALLGLLDWAKADIMKDILESASSPE